VHIHGISDVDIIQHFLKRYPVVRSMHDLRLVCPGTGKFLLNSEAPCTKPFGLHCLYKAYTESCQGSRKPAAVLNAYSRVRYEISQAALEYKAVITVSDYLKNEALEAGIQSESVHVIPYFTKFSIPPHYHSTQKTKRVLFVGRLAATKGVFYLIKAMIPILQTSQDVVLDIVGDGYLKTEISSLIAKEKMSSKIILHAWKSTPEVSAMMSASYLLALTSIYPECFGLVGIEAFAHSKPVVAFDVGGVSSWLIDGFNGYLVENKNADQFRSRVDKLLSDNSTHKEFSNNAYTSFQHNFTPERHVESFIKIYTESLSQ